MALQVTTQHERGECRRRLEFSPGKKRLQLRAVPAQTPPKRLVGHELVSSRPIRPTWCPSWTLDLSWLAGFGRWPRGYGEVVASLDGGVRCVGPQPSAESFSKLQAGDPNMATPHVPWSRSSLLASSGRVNAGGCVTDLNCLSPFCLGIPGSVGRSVVSATAMPDCGHGGYTPCPNLLQHEAISAVRLFCSSVRRGHVLGNVHILRGPRSVHRRETRRWWSVVGGRWWRGGRDDETTVKGWTWERWRGRRRREERGGIACSAATRPSTAH